MISKIIRDAIKFQRCSKRIGYYIDIGANETTIQSQTYHLEKLGWRGLLIEALPYYANLLKKKRTGKVIQFAVSSPKNHNKKLKFIGIFRCFNEYVKFL